jgi:hypothetical protein
MKDNRLLDGKAVRDRILDEVAARVHDAAATHPIGRMVSISIGEQKPLRCTCAVRRRPPDG